MPSALGFESPFIPSQFDEVEDVDNYRPGGFHPVQIGDKFSAGRYRIIHKLGFGGSSTIWLARDEKFSDTGSGKLVAVKALRADESTTDYPDLVIPKLLQRTGPSHYFRIVEDHFFVDGPNGRHQFLVSALAGPSVLAILDFPQRRRLRVDLAKKLARQAACALEHIHSAGFVHGDFTTSNLLFRLSHHAVEWSDDEVYLHLGEPVTDTVRTWTGEPVGPHAPSSLTEAIDHSLFTETKLLQENILVADFGQAYTAAMPPEDHKPRTRLNYMSPEALFEGRAGPEADVWALGCAIFEIRAGFPLFDSFFPSHTEIITQMVCTLGRLPDTWWDAFKNQGQFEEDGRPKKNTKLLLSSIRERLCSLGEIPASKVDPMFENTEMKVDEKEVNLLADLLEKMMRYRPEDRIRIREVVNHSWFGYDI
ncbi:kinase-like protein [Lentinula edodes]|uniref:Kinase-like protein n=1 Tax=Lentinula lateritia TaxID=40482 RepID=A0A9W9ASX5_9AGAR|nr:kinase-like protein [Lentinula edodes]